MKNPEYTVIGIVALAFVGLFIHSCANAQTACGVGGTAKSASGVEVTRTNEQAAKDSVRIVNGEWWKCQMPKPSVNLDCRMSGGIKPTWVENGVTCTSSRVITGPVKHGEVIQMTSGTRGTIGYQRMRCNDGVPQSEYIFCMKR